MKRKPATPRKSKPRTGVLRIVRWVIIAAFCLWAFGALLVVSLKWIDPRTTAVQTQRRVQSWFHKPTYKKQYTFVPLSQISPNLQHAVISAEDAHFYQHHGFDWEAIQKAAQDDWEGDRIRGGSTLTQQLVKNLFFGTGRSFLRKGAEATLVPVAEVVLGKQRILELYLNVVEWGPGVYGAEAASRYHYKTSARRIGREESARLAAILPSPRRRRPERMNNYSAVILRRMSQMNW